MLLKSKASRWLHKSLASLHQIDGDKDLKRKNQKEHVKAR